MKQKIISSITVLLIIALYVKTIYALENLPVMYKDAIVLSEVEYDKMQDALRCKDIFKYFQELKGYESPLQQMTFKNTSEYVKFVDSLKTIKKGYINKRYIVKHWRQCNELVGNYDVKNKCFWMKLFRECGAMNFFGVEAPPEKLKEVDKHQINEIWFPQLPIKIAIDKYDGYKTVNLKLPLSDNNTAIEIENANKLNNTEAYIGFVTNGKVIMTDYIIGSEGYIFIVNKINKECIYYSKIYPTKDIRK